MTFESIINHGEFFSDHYLTSMVDADLKDLRKQWLQQEKHGDSARSRLRQLTSTYPSVRSAAAKARDSRPRARSHQAVEKMNKMVLRALSFEPQPSVVELTRTGEHTVTVKVVYDTAASNDPAPSNTTTANNPAPSNTTTANNPAPSNTTTANNPAPSNTRANHTAALDHRSTAEGSRESSYGDTGSSSDTTESTSRGNGASSDTTESSSRSNGSSSHLSTDAHDRLLVVQASFTDDTDQFFATSDKAERTASKAAVGRSAPQHGTTGHDADFGSAVGNGTVGSGGSGGGPGTKYQTRSELLSPVTSTADKKKRSNVGAAIGEIFATDIPPRYVLVVAGPIVLLAERAKWAEGRYLAVHLDGAMERNDRKVKGELETIAALFSADALLPQDQDGRSFHDELNERSVKHAVGVSKDLRDGVRQSVEILANEVIDLLDQQAERQHRRKFSRSDVNPAELTRQCLRYLYRLLVLLFAESRPELGVLPTNDDAYMTGYSLDRLRELVVGPLPAGSAEGTHLHHSLQLLFRLANRGNHEKAAEQQLFTGEGVERQGSAEIYLQFPGLDAALFEESADPLIGKVQLRNQALHRVLQLLMLAPGKKKRDQAGFISYAQLGINQLGAVYEDLMAYSGFFATEELVEVAKNGDPSDGTWMLPVDESYEYPEEVFVTQVDKHGERKRVKHPAGSFVYRLSGRDRQRSASYYTPEVLTECVVHHTLAEMLGLDAEVMRGLGFDAPDGGSAGITKAEDLLSITICEPALGSGAFANEAINQLSAEYLRRRQQELGERLDPDRYQHELAKTKAHFALNQTYGVDLNATAVELAEVSLWLNCIHPGLKQPWFGLRLRQGNSLIGCRRATWTTSQLKSKPWKATKTKKTSITPPEPRPLAEPLAADEIHHFLLPGHGWAAIADKKEAKALAPDQAKALKKWRNQILAAPGPNHAQRLTRLAKAVETTWTEATKMLDTVAKRMHRDFNLYGQKPTKSSKTTSTTNKPVTSTDASENKTTTAAVSGQAATDISANQANSNLVISQDEPNASAVTNKSVAAAEMGSDHETMNVGTGQNDDPSGIAEMGSDHETMNVGTGQSGASDIADTSTSKAVTSTAPSRNATNRRISRNNANVVISQDAVTERLDTDADSGGQGSSSAAGTGRGEMGQVTSRNMTDKSTGMGGTGVVRGPGDGVTGANAGQDAMDVSGGRRAVNMVANQSVTGVITGRTEPATVSASTDNPWTTGDPNEHPPANTQTSKHKEQIPSHEDADAGSGRDKTHATSGHDDKQWATSEHEEHPQATTLISDHRTSLPSRYVVNEGLGVDATSAAAGPGDEEWTLSREKVEQLLASDRTPLGRLRALMDAWIGLWYWPITIDTQPPNWEQWLKMAEQLIGVDDNTHTNQPSDTDNDLNGIEHQLDFLSLLREMSESDTTIVPGRKLLEELKRDHPWLEVTSEAAERADAWHWELEFAPVFHERGGFDLQIGNPPWVQPNWEESLVLAETDPWWGLQSKSVSASERKGRHSELLAASEFAHHYLDELADHTAMRALLRSILRWPLLSGLRTDLHLNFIDIMLSHTASITGCIGMLHPDTLYRDKKAGLLRSYIYSRLRRHFSFTNGLKLFMEVHGQQVYGIHIYGAKRETTKFLQVAGLYHPATITYSFQHNGIGELPSAQLSKGGLDLRPHQTRLVCVNEAILTIWRDLRDHSTTSVNQTLLMFPLTQTELEVQAILAEQPKLESPLTRNQISSTTGWDETQSVQDEVIRKDLGSVTRIEEVILKGADIGLALPLAREPKTKYYSRRDVVNLSLQTLPIRRIPRTVYKLTDKSLFLDSYSSENIFNNTATSTDISNTSTLDSGQLGIPLWNGRYYSAYFRHAHRFMCHPSNERSVICALLPPGPTHVITMVSVRIDNNRATVLWNGMLSSIIIDYLIRVAQIAAILPAVFTRLPAPQVDHPLAVPVILRTLRLNCLMDFYAPLWADLFTRSWHRDSWSDPSFTGAELGDVEPEWRMATPLRCDDERRRALVELDALVALMLGVSAEQLCAIYRASFGVLRKYEHRMAFDAQGHKICGFHHSAGYKQAELQGRARGGELPQEWKSIWKLYERWEEDPTSVDWRGHFEPPFVRADREAEMTQAHNEFQRRLDTGEYS